MFAGLLQALRQMRRAPARILVSVFALSLAVGAIGVFAIPTVSTSSLRDAAERDGIPQIVFYVSDTGAVDVNSALAGVDNVVRAEPQVLTSAKFTDGRDIDLLGVDLGNQQMDIVRAEAGRLPRAFGEVVVSEGVAPIGAVLETTRADGSSTQLTVVGTGGTSFWNDSEVAFAELETASAIEGIDGANRMVVSTSDTSKDTLRETASAVRTRLGEEEIVVQTLPFTVPDGRHPIEAEIEQISSLIGFLGIVAGLVALVLLGSTATTLITERTREVAVMRALGATNRVMRRRLRRLAMSIALASVVLGVPLGVLISNLIARLVLEEFIGLTPGFAVSVPVMVASAAFALVGARIVAAGAARRVTGRPLVDALRDRNGAPFGRKLSERIASRFAIGSLLDRTAVRSGLHRRSRSIAILAQVAAAVSALLIIASMATTITDFNQAEIDPIRWSSRTFVDGPGLDIDASIADDDPNAEVGSDIGGEVLGWGIDVRGFQPDTRMLDRTMDAGSWFERPGDAVVSTGFAERVGIAIGDRVDVEIGSGEVSYTVVGLHPDRGRSVFVDVDELAVDMNRPGFGNVLMSTSPETPSYLTGDVSIERLDELSEDDSGRTAILLIFSAIGAIVVSVAGLAVASGLGVNVFERRAEFAALQAVGGRRRHVFRVVVAELFPVAVGGIGLGLVGGYFGARAIARSFEASNAVEIGFTYATGAVPVAAAVVLLGSLLIGALMVRQVTRHPVAQTLRGVA